MDSLGPNIRRQRKLRGLTLKQLSEKTGLSVSFLSEMERGLAQPSMASLRKVAQALGTSLLTFEEGHLPEGEPREGLSYPAERVRAGENFIQETKVVRAGQRKKISYPERPGIYELLTPDLNRRLEVLWIRMEPGFESGPEAIVDPPGEKCLVILSGTLSFTVDGVEHLLDKGDSISYPASAPVEFKVLGEEKVEAILVITPPGF